jgi:diguanylate cyclase (GGDEF)-like protein
MWLISRQFFKNKLHEYEDADTIRMQRDELYHLYNEESLTDDLTQIGNRRFIRKSFEALRTACVHDHKSMTLMFIDGDDLKSINDQFGHSSGDTFLKIIGEALEKYGTDDDTAIGRYGGDEFILISKDMSQNLAREAGENIRQYVQSHTQFEDGRSGTVSIGFIVIPDSEIDDFNTVISQADALMYSAKKLGKNQVISL